MSKKYLIKFSADWADEFDMNGFIVMTEEELEKYKTGMKNEEYPYEAGFGTNEWFDFESSDDVMRELTILEISEEEATIFEQHFKGGYFGWIPGYWRWLKEN